MSWRIDVEVQLGSRRWRWRGEGDEEPDILVGPNGAGKTTFLRVLAGFVSPRAGWVELEGRRIFDAEAGIDVPPHQRGVGYVPQGYALFPHLSVRDNVAFAQRRGEGVDALMERLEIAHLADRRPDSLSGGEQQRVALARALSVGRPRLLLMDEPMSALDAGARRRTRGFLVEQLRAQPSIVVTHDPRDVRALGGRLHVLEDEGITRSGPWAEVAASKHSAFVSELFDHGLTRP
jgi:molybdate transport system ATP-binding protein